MIGHHEEIQRAAQTNFLAACRPDPLTLGETIGIVRHEPVAKNVAVYRQGSVHVGIAPIDIVRVGLADLRGIGFRGERTERHGGERENE